MATRLRDPSKPFHATWNPIIDDGLPPAAPYVDPTEVVQTFGPSAPIAAAAGYKPDPFALPTSGGLVSGVQGGPVAMPFRPPELAGAAVKNIAPAGAPPVTAAPAVPTTPTAPSAPASEDASDLYLAALQKAAEKNPLGTVVGGSTSSGGSTVQVAKKQLPGWQGEQEKITGKAIAAKEKEAQADARMSAQQEAATTRWTAEQQGYQTAQAQRTAERERQFADYNKKVDAKVKEISGAQLDPDRWFRDLSAGRKVALILGAAISGFGQGWRGQGGENPVLALANQMIDRDIAAQRANIERKQGDLTNLRGSMADFMRQGETIDAAQAQAKIGALEIYKTRLEQARQAAESPKVQARADQAIAALQEASLRERRQAFLDSQNTVTRTSSGSTTRVPIMQLLQQAQLAKAKAEAGGEKGAASELKPIPDATMAEITKLRAARAALDRVAAQSVDMWIGKRRLTPELISTNMQVLRQSANNAMNQLRAALPNFEAKSASELIGALGSGSGDIQQVTGNYKGMLNDQIDTLLSQHSPDKFDLESVAKQEAKARQLSKYAGAGRAIQR